MRFFDLALLSLAPLCLASPTPVADDSVAELATRADGVQVVLKAFSLIQSATKSLDAGVLAINTTDINDQLPLAGQSQTVIDTINNQTALVAKASGIPLSCVLNVGSKAQELIDVVAVTLKDLKGKKKFTDGSGASSIVVVIVQQLLVAADHFINALKPKVPSSAQFLVSGDKRQLDLLLSGTITYFQQPPAA